MKIKFVRNSKDIKYVKYGFSWVTLFFSVGLATKRKDWEALLIYLLLFILDVIIIGLIILIKYSKYHLIYIYLFNFNRADIVGLCLAAIVLPFIFNIFYSFISNERYMFNLLLQGYKPYSKNDATLLGHYYMYNPPYMYSRPTKEIILKNRRNVGLKIKLGFDWRILVFGFIPLILKKDYVAGLFCYLFNFTIFVPLLLAYVGNDRYINWLLKRGFFANYLPKAIANDPRVLHRIKDRNLDYYDRKIGYRNDRNLDYYDRKIQHDKKKKIGYYPNDRKIEHQPKRILTKILNRPNYEEYFPL